MIVELINSINRFLGYLNISPKYLNRLYTLLALIPMGYHIRLLYLFWKGHQTGQFISFLLLFLVFVYFWSINVFYYFFDKNTRYDVTQWIAEVVPDEVFDGMSSSKEEIDLKNVQINKYSNVELIMEEIIDKKLIELNDEKEGYLIPKNTLFPFYTLEQKDKDVEVKIGTSYDDLITVGVYKGMKVENIDGLFIYGGYFYSEGTKFKDRYYLKLHLKTA